ncbi:dipeptidase [Cupriavidus plantarum]|uniref:dipeptidase n=1 Tax=Cupriavidus plantarum TaxID=942865 RepID=UPI001FD33C7A|nr:membrane dipeptidase [Cupriavidus plantarum]
MTSNIQEARLPVEADAATTALQFRPRRRAFLAFGAALGVVACAPGRSGERPEGGTVPWRASPGAVTIDMHSHAGRVTLSRDPATGLHRAFTSLRAPMVEGGMNVICLAIVADTAATRVSADRKRFEAWRKPEPGELYRLSQLSFERAKALCAEQGLGVVTDAGALRTAGDGPRVIITAEGADFLEGAVERVDEAFEVHKLRQLQLTHYRVNELGDIQTEAPAQGGLTDFGAHVVRRCNALGIVVDVAHGTYDLVKRAATVSTKPLVLSHTALVSRPTSRGRSISADHARAVADTGGVIGIWPSAGSFHDLREMAHGFKRMADVVGVEHVGLGTDMLGFISPPVFTNYAQLPLLGSALLAEGFSQAETEQVLGGNYRRVFDASIAPRR